MAYSILVINAYKAPKTSMSFDCIQVATNLLDIGVVFGCSGSPNCSITSLSSLRMWAPDCQIRTGVGVGGTGLVGGCLFPPPEPGSSNNGSSCLFCFQGGIAALFEACVAVRVIPFRQCSADKGRRSLRGTRLSPPRCPGLR